MQDIKTVPPEFGQTAKKEQTDSVTFEQYFHNYLYQHGMFPQQAQAVLDSIRNEEPFKDLFGKAKDGYPPMMLGILKQTIDAAAVKWIDANKPKAWFRACFVK